MGVIKVGVLADTHIPGRAWELPPAVLNTFEGVDLILHAGDVVRRQVLDTLNKLAPVEAVCGNVDDLDLRLTLPRQKVLEVGGFRIGLLHGDYPDVTALARARAAFQSRPDGRSVHCVVFGHSHQSYCQTQGGVLYFNPGSPTDRRRALRPSCGLLHVDGEIRGEVIWL